jgi:hypothetical protein
VSAADVGYARLRVVVCVAEAAAESRRLLAEGARLAQRLGSELVAAFVCNPALPWSAALPFTRAVTRFGLADGDFDPASARRALRLIAEEVESLAAELARRSGVACAFLELEFGPGSRGLRPGDVLVAGADELRALLAAIGTLELPPGTALAVRERRPGSVVALSAGDPTTLSLLARLVEDTGTEAVLHLIGPAAAGGEPLQGLLARLEAMPGVRIRRASDPREALKAAASDIIEEGAGGVILDGALAATALGHLLDALAGRRAGTAGDTGAGETGEKPSTAAGGPTA